MTEILATIVFSGIGIAIWMAQLPEEIRNAFIANEDMENAWERYEKKHLTN